jgi:TolA-binding protein
MYMLFNWDGESKLSIFLVLLLLLFSGSALAQISAIPPSASETGLGGVNSIIGTVFGPSGRPVEGRIRIRLSTMTGGDRIFTTDNNGSFAFRGLPTGTYSVIIDREKEFEPFSQDVDIRQFRGSPPQVYTLNIRLKLKEQDSTNPGVINTELANVPKQALDFYNKALELVKKGNYKEAIEQFQLSINKYPDFMLAFSEMGVQYLRLNELEKADESFQSALKIKPDAFAPMMNRGIVLVQMKRYAEAEPLLRNVLKAKESPVGHYFLGQTLANLGRFDEAEKEFLSALSSGGEQMKESHRFLAIIYSARGDKKRAADQLETYLHLTPKAPDAEQLRNVIKQLKNSN